jgi:demethylmenaquinone methyltransferase/2-methoxy-6-polyprenyl-1,4-benzoquinol methylase/phosphoethanolamine N-methyltransferase
VDDPPEAPATRGIVLDHAASLYDLLMPVVTLGTEHRINRRAVDILAPAPGDAVLDVGCATGRLTLEVARRLLAAEGGLCVGLDAAPRMIARARRKIGSWPCRFDVGLAEQLPYPDATFPKAISTFFFHHLCLEDKSRALRELHRVLVPGGRAVIVDVDVPTNWFGRLCARSGQWLFRQPEIGENIDGLLVPLFAEAGFADLQPAAHDMGYVTTFLMRRPPAETS